jgi:hypothetical protein
MSTSVHSALTWPRQQRPAQAPVNQPATMPKPKPKPGAPGKPGQPGKPRPKPGPKKLYAGREGRRLRRAQRFEARPVAGSKALG